MLDVIIQEFIIYNTSYHLLYKKGWSGINIDLDLEKKKK